MTRLFCSVLWLSLIRGLATPWMYFLHLSLSSVILIDSSTESPVHILMLSIQAVRGIPCLRAPGIVPCLLYISMKYRNCPHLDVDNDANDYDIGDVDI